MIERDRGPRANDNTVVKIAARADLFIGFALAPLSARGPCFCFSVSSHVTAMLGRSRPGDRAVPRLQGADWVKKSSGTSVRHWRR